MNQNQQEDAPHTRTLNSYIKSVILESDDINSNSFHVSLKTFQSYVKFRYQKLEFESDTNFLNDIFLEINLNEIKNPRHYLILLHALIGIEIGNKITKANHIARDLPVLPPTDDRIVYKYLEKILLWLSNILSSSMHIVLQPLREKIWILSKSNKDDVETSITSLYLLIIFLKKFPSSLNAYFENIQTIVFTSIQSNNLKVRKLGIRVLKSAFKLTKTPYSAHIWPLFNALTNLIANYPDTLFNDVVTSLYQKCEKNESFASAFHFKSFPFDDLSDSGAARHVLPLVFLCSPQIFSDIQIHQILKLYLKLIKKSHSNKDILLQLGEISFLISRRIHTDFSKESEEIFHYLYKVKDKSDEIIYSLLSLVSADSSQFYEILGKIHSVSLSKLIIKGLVKLFQKWPSKSEFLRKKIFATCTSTILNVKSDNLIKHSFVFLNIMNIKATDMTNELLLHYSLYLSHPNYKIRKACAFFLLKIQSLFPIVQKRLLSFVCTETIEELRVSVFEKIDENNPDFLMPLFRSSSPSIRDLALIKLCRIQKATSFISNYVHEMVICVKQGVQMSKHDLHSIYIISNSSFGLIKPYAPFFSRKILEKPKQANKVALKLLVIFISKIPKIDINIEALTRIISTSLNKHTPPKKIKVALDLLIASISYTSLRQSIRGAHSSLYIKLINISKYASNDMKLLLFDAIIKIGAINPSTITMKNHEVGTIGHYEFMDMTQNPKVAQLLNFSVITSLRTLGEILSDDSLLNIQPQAVEALLSILRRFPSTNETLETVIRNKVLDIGRKSMALLMNNIPDLLLIFGEKIEPLIPFIMESIFESWGKMDTSLLLQSINWLSLTVPNIFKEYIVKITVLMTSSLTLQPLHIVKEIIGTIAAYNSSIKYVDYIIVPALISLIECNADNSDLANDTLYQFRNILCQCDASKFAVELIKALILVVKQNKNLKKNANELILVLLYQMKANFFIFFPDIINIFDLDKVSDFNTMISEIKSNADFDIMIDLMYGPPPPLELPPNTISKNEHQNTTHFTFNLPNSDWDAYEWEHWCDEFIPNFLLNSPSHAISVSTSLCERDYNIRSLLFPITFALSALNEPELIEGVLKVVIESNTVPNNILTYFVHVCELLDIAGQQLPFSWSVLAKKAVQINILPLALRFTEYIFERNPSKAAEDLININQRLGFYNSANSILEFTGEMKAKFYNMLGKWNLYLDYYKTKLDFDPENSEFKFEKLMAIENLDLFIDLDNDTKNDISLFSASAALHTFSFDRFVDIMSNLNITNSYKFLYFETMAAILKKDYTKCDSNINKLKTYMSNIIFPSISENYSRTFPYLCRACLIEEINDVVNMRKLQMQLLSSFPIEKLSILEKIKNLEKNWETKFEEVYSYPSLMYEILIIRSMILEEEKMVPYFVKFLYANAQNGQSQMSQIIYHKIKDNGSDEIKFVKILMTRYSGNKEEALSELLKLNFSNNKYSDILAKWYYEDGKISEAYHFVSKQSIKDSDLLIKLNFSMFRITRKFQYLMQSFTCLVKQLQETANNSIINERYLNSSESRSLKYALKIISIILEYRDFPELDDFFLSSIELINPSVWLPILPQIIARITSTNLKLREITLSLVLFICKTYPKQVLISIFVPLISVSDEKHETAFDLMEIIKDQFPELVEDTILFANQLMKIAQTQWEAWYNELDECSKALVYHGDVIPTIELLDTLFVNLQQKPESLYEILFQSQFAPMLLEAEEKLKGYIETEDQILLHQAWSIFVNVFQLLNPYISSLDQVSLADVSPYLSSIHSSINVPGTSIKLHKIDENVRIIQSKQRPRKIGIFDIEGTKRYFLLKPNEDTRLDMRAMQLFNIISSFVNDIKLKIQTFYVVPLSTNFGLMEWMDDCTTIFDLIKHERKKKSIPISLETNLMKGKDISDVYVFKKMLTSTKGDEIARYLLETAMNSNDWIHRRITYTASLAATSIAGYIMGIGDRHLSNIMIMNKTAKIVHIDFGDCFEVTLHRENYPECVPFRLTRVLLNGLEVTQADGSFRNYCEDVMKVLRENKVVILGLLETFIYDPLLDCESIFGDINNIIKRIKDKLKGTDFDNTIPLSVEEQVDQLIRYATDINSLAAMYSGWNPWL
ncbi:PIKK family atypical protein kinase [Tritrichomonas foetus]|uniref:non-specific serine/threonine protein kinase n=1 Tax=Tritrichomonas foetus TaxID=1144522 RepID=A0A1J4JZA7_9EUKA|nr:PIKK family atypical protein kinase [Tritrichomonas foetus]|eukprot:OHT04315.1 PIKK family atypical protein kinase [Tritrichomonas foetus]